jgi:hypothetical protein
MQYEPSQKIYDCDRVDLAMTPEGDTVVLTWPIAAGDSVLNLGLSREKAEQLHYQLGLLLNLSVMQPPIGTVGFVRMTEVSAVDAGPTETPGTIVLSLTLEGGSVHHFRLPRELSAALRPRMRSAEAAPPLKVERQ